MKKIVAVLLVLCMSWSVMACGVAKEEMGASVVGEKEGELPGDMQEEMETDLSEGTQEENEVDLSEDIQEETETELPEDTQEETETDLSEVAQEETETDLSEDTQEETETELPENTQEETESDLSEDAREENETELPQDTRAEKMSLVTIGGKEYDLAGNFQDVVGAMVKGGVKVTSLSGKWLLYDEDGKYNKDSSAFEDGYDIAAEERNQTGYFSPEKKKEIEKEQGFLIRRDFYLDKMEKRGIVSDLGVSSVNDIEKNIDAETFLEIVGGNSAYINGKRGYVGVFVDGEALDFSDYEEALEELKNYTVIGKGGLIGERFPHMSAIGIGILCGDIYRVCKTYEELEETMNKRSLSLEKELLVWLAFEDAYERLEAEEAEYFAFVSFGISDEKAAVNMSYHQFYFDKNWSAEKFQ